MSEIKTSGITKVQETNPATEPQSALIMYAVRNRDGQYFRAKGYGGSGESWIEGLARARIYPRPGPARQVVTFSPPDSRAMAFPNWWNCM